MYKTQPNNFVLRIADNAYIPADPLNADRQEYDKWLAEGNTPLPADEPTPAERRAKAKVDIDQAAGRARQRYASPGDMIAQEYREAEVDAQAYKDAGYLGTAPATVQSWADATGNTTTWAADDILAAGQNLRTVLASIRAKRLNGKAAVNSALDADIEATAEQYIAQLDALK